MASIAHHSVIADCLASATSLVTYTKCNTKKIRLVLSNTPFHYAPQPNCRFNTDANIGHAFGIFMAYVGALQPSASGAG